MNTVVGYRIEEINRQIEMVLSQLENHSIEIDGEDEDIMSFLACSEGEKLEVNGITFTFLGSEIVDVSIEDGYYTKHIYFEIHGRIYRLVYSWSEWGMDNGWEYQETIEMDYYTPSKSKIKTN